MSETDPGYGQSGAKNGGSVALTWVTANTQKIKTNFPKKLLPYDRNDYDLNKL